MIDPKVLAQVRAAINGTAIRKVAFSPLTPEAQAAAQAQMQGGAGAPPPPGAGMPPPMDPAAMGGQPPMDPAMMGGQPPMDPAMMDPAMMGGQPPMDPAMMGGQPPMDPAAMGGAPAQPTPVQVTLEDLQAMFGQKDDAANQANADMMGAISALGEQIQALAQAMGVSLPSEQTGAGADPGIPVPAEPAALDAMTQGMLAPQAAPKTASQGSNKLLDTVKRLKRYGG